MRRPPDAPWWYVPLPWLVAFMWLTVVPPLVLVVARATGHLDVQLVFVASTFAPVVLVPAYAVLGFAVSARRWVLLAASAMCVVAHVAWTLPEFPHHPDLPAAAREAPRLTVYTHNVLFQRPSDAGALIDQILALDPDVIALQELTPPDATAIAASAIDERWPYSFVMDRDGPWGSGIWSKYPIIGQEHVLVTEGNVPAVRLRTPAGPVTIANVHTNAPRDRAARQRWEHEFDLLTRWVQDQPGYVVVVGDFNATMQHAPFRDLLDTGLRDAHLERGDGWAATFPADRSFPPVLRIDHVLVGDDVEVLEVGSGDATGSDHKPVWAVLALTS
ncbi:MAG: endonuclease/exonuclease/phosphatase family protein [Acidimicrobiales bacterium]|nr:endonuclease/exonuclease/phosphatase family protein [Acidimicrobiales bacterium]